MVHQNRCPVFWKPDDIREPEKYFFEQALHIKLRGRTTSSPYQKRLLILSNREKLSLCVSLNTSTSINSFRKSSLTIFFHMGMCRPLFMKSAWPYESPFFPF